MLYYVELFWTISTCISFFISRGLCQTTQGTTKPTFDPAEYRHCYEGECRKSELGGRKCGFPSPSSRYRISWDNEDTLPNQSRSDKFCVSFIWTSLTAAGTLPQKPIDAIRREVGNVAWEVVTKITSKLNKTASQSCVGIDNLELIYPNLTRLYRNATMCACNTDKCNTDYIEERFAKNPTSSLSCKSCPRAETYCDASCCDLEPEQCLSDQDACLKWEGLINAGRSLYLTGCVLAADIPRFGTVDQCLVSPRIRGVVDDYDVNYAVQGIKNSTSYLCQSNMCNDDKIMVDRHTLCTPTPYIGVYKPPNRITKNTADCLRPPLRPLLIAAVIMTWLYIVK